MNEVQTSRYGPSNEWIKYYVHLKAKNREAALKIGNEKISQYIAKRNGRSDETSITDYELEKVKNRVEADLLLNEIGYLEKAIQLASFEIMGDASEINRQGEHYLSITATDLLETARTLFRKGNRNTLNYLALQNPKK